MGMSPLGDLDPSAGACRRGRLWKTRDVDAWLRQTMDAIGSDAELTDADADAAKPKCNGSPGRSYTQDDIRRTGAIDLADALRRLDPAVH